jgi:exosome complex RNA-binding protein Csl4
VRATEKDKVKIGDCFRGGDVVKALVVWYSLPDTQPRSFLEDFSR